MRFYDLLIHLAEKRNRIIVHFFFVSAAAVIFSLTLTKLYKSTVLFLPPSSQGNGLMSLVSADISSMVMSSDKFSARQYVTILKSRELREKVIEKFDLKKRYKIDNIINPTDKALELFAKNVDIELNETGALGMTEVVSIEFSVIDSDPDSASMIANYMYELMEEKAVYLSSRSDRKGIEFLERQQKEYQSALDYARDTLKQFQIRNKIYNVNAQVEYVLDAVSGYEAEKMLLEKKRDYLRLSTRGEFSEIKAINERISVIEKKLEKLESKEKPDLLIGLTRSLNLSGRFYDLKKEVETYRTVLLLVRKQLEQLRLKEAKNFSDLSLVDKARPAEYKSKPKRAYVVLAVVFIYMLTYLFYVSSRFYWHRYEELSPEKSAAVKKLVSLIFSRHPSK
ncbi:MAG: Wzz/FepE/Etk N-terminal domain-containing protein [Fibrobacterota bacterium]